MGGGRSYSAKEPTGGVMGCALSVSRGNSPSWPACASGPAGSWSGELDECAMDGLSTPGLLDPWGLWGSYVSDRPRNIVFKLSNIIGRMGFWAADEVDCRGGYPPPIVVLLKVKRPSGDL
jgi:hypothetical protein